MRRYARAAGVRVHLENGRQPGQGLSVRGVDGERRRRQEFVPPSTQSVCGTLWDNNLVKVNLRTGFWCRGVTTRPVVPFTSMFMPEQEVGAQYTDLFMGSEYNGVI